MPCVPAGTSDAPEGGRDVGYGIGSPLEATGPDRNVMLTCASAVPGAAGEIGEVTPLGDVAGDLSVHLVTDNNVNVGKNVDDGDDDDVVQCHYTRGRAQGTNPEFCQDVGRTSPSTQNSASILAVTRSQSARDAETPLPDGHSVDGADNGPECVPESPSGVLSLASCLAASTQEFQAAVLADASLEALRDIAGKPPPNSGKERVYWDQGRLYRESVPDNPQQEWLRERQLIVPYQFREELLRVAHEIPLAGHLGVGKTKSRLAQHFYWPHMGTDVANYCRSCITCQKVGKSGPAPKAPLIPLPVIEEPFQRVAVDLIGPLAVPSTSGKRLILTVVDYATRYPEAIALSSIRADKVADALLGIFSRVGFPREMLTDQGTQFMSNLMQCLCKRIQVQHMRASPYHPQTNGLCERFNGTLKQMLKMLVELHGRDWERYLPHLLFAYREVPQASTGFSPFELLYGRRVRGPLTLVREAWDGELHTPEESVIEYVMRFRDRMQTLARLVQDNMVQAQATQKQWYDRNTRDRVYQEGQKVWVLVPMTQNKLQAAWEGPYVVHKRLNEVNYIVTIDHARKRQKVFHVNMMKAHHEWGACTFPVCSAPEEGEAEVLLDLLATAQDSRSLKDAEVNSQLSGDQESQVKRVLHPFLSTFTGKPGRTQLAVHHVDTTDNSPIRQSAYRVSLEVQADMKREIEEMLHLGVIQKSKSAWASPVVLVPKKDRTTRFCVDYRKLNAITVLDAYPMPRIDELLDRLASAQYITILDLSRGYWQIPMSQEARERSAFITPFGLYESLVMPFGMKNAPATFQRLVDQLLEGLGGFAVAYLDDIAIFSSTWEDHLKHLNRVLRKIQAAGLTIKPEKCQIAMTEVQYLGHRVGGGVLKPEPGKVDAISTWPTPRTKKQVMSFLGTAGYYRKFVPGYSALAKPLTDLTKKKLPQMVNWTAECEQSFSALKAALSSAPVLQAPDFRRRFMVQTDASAYGLGAVLSQVNSDGEEHPVLYLSRKLLPREVAYATVEKECLAIVWALRKLQSYLYGRNFTIVTDHNPLSWLHRMAGENGKLLRWSLSLQQYDFTIHHKKGSEHGNADGLSRQGEAMEVGVEGGQ
ncbi:K02A2.6-like [Pristimantis euphronides]